MSFLKFWKGRPKGVSRGGYADESGDPSSSNMGEHGEFEDMDGDKRGRLKHSLSISRSGRYKAKKKERTGFLDKPDIFDGPENEENPSQTKSSVSNQSPSSSQRGSQSNSHRRNSSNPTSCREGTQISSLRLKHPTGITSQQPTAV